MKDEVFICFKEENRIKKKKICLMIEQAALAQLVVFWLRNLEGTGIVLRDRTC